MKYHFLLLFALLCSVSSFAQGESSVKRFAALAPVSADNHGIIYDQPEGTTRLYIREGKATYANLYFRDDPQDGILAEAVFSEDGTTVWFKNIVSHAATGTWVKGTISGDSIIVPLGQMVYWFEDGDYGMQLARVKVNGSINNPTTTTKGEFVFIIKDNDLYLQNTSGDAETTTYDGLGLVYTEYRDDNGKMQPAGEWAYYIDYESIFHFKDVTPVTPPAALTTRPYSMEYQSTSGFQTGNLVDVGFYDQDVYVYGVSHDNLPDAWMKGSVSADKIVFPMQYAGHMESFMLFFCGGEAYYDSEAYAWKYVLGDGSATFAFDQRTMSFRTEGMLATNSADDHVDRIEAYLAPLFRPFTEKPATPATPGIRFYQNMGAFTIVMLDLPLKDTEGNFIDPAKVSYQLYIDDDEPFILYPDEYKGLTEPLSEVPYFFPADKLEDYSRSYIYERGYAIYIFQTGFDRIGVQTIYRGGEEEHRSEIGYYDIVPVGVSGISSDAGASVQHFDLTGRPVSSNHKGLTISRDNSGRVVKHFQR